MELVNEEVGGGRGGSNCLEGGLVLHRKNKTEKEGVKESNENQESERRRTVKI